MSIPNPEPGLVISHAYLRQCEQEAGSEEGLTPSAPIDLALGPVLRYFGYAA